MTIKSHTDSLTFLGTMFHWQARVPSELTSKVFDPNLPFWVNFAHYEIDTRTRECYVRCYDFCRLSATWLTGPFTATHQRFSVEVILSEGRLLRWRFTSTLQKWLEDQILSLHPELPLYDFWLAKTLSSALRDHGLTDAKKVITAYQLNPKQHGAIDELLNRFHTPFGIEAAKRLNRQHGPIASITEQDYEVWVANHATKDSFLIGMHNVGRPRCVPQCIFKALIKIMSRWLFWKPVLLMDSVGHKLTIGGIEFPLESHKTVLSRLR